MDQLKLNPLLIECTLFFQGNPYAYETVDGLALRIGRDPEDLFEILNQMVETSVLEVVGTGESAIYHYIKPVETIDMQQEQL
ncbi:hypothetical protein [Desertibacillus haloalkaliphilus]|uniref:hypothetical protein n=1 Tax=Desertibacillus haloalkaliphilus TaxID=1328930 RepID=UPI001C25D458|nr:hypothetical protein [Desertibacillus haloalkaliphilus]MBU8906282.1 hypothetical protein [Desertibacillus haloalkaliphilus]